MHTGPASFGFMHYLAWWAILNENMHIGVSAGGLKDLLCNCITDMWTETVLAQLTIDYYYILFVIDNAKRSSKCIVY